jgi:hypothetical protein
MATTKPLIVISQPIPASALERLRTYAEVEMGKDYGIGSNPNNSQFFVYAKDLGLTDDILIRNVPALPVKKPNPPSLSPTLLLYKHSGTVVFATRTF